jgi:dCTP diphosphatase
MKGPIRNASDGRNQEMTKSEAVHARRPGLRPPRPRARPAAPKSAPKYAFQDLIDDLRVFARERDWNQYHTPKNLSMALAVEAAELMEIFQWLTPAESRKLKPIERAEVKDEIGDVMIYLVRLADRLSISPLEAARAKLVKSRRKYPVEKARGNARKYTKF